ncbi:MAG: uroporphyrinogen-III synthase, partial [bacterium]|nr:uroporphyrinogen-III synthase [bacterium]
GEIPSVLKETILQKGGLLRHGTPYAFHPPENPAAVPDLIKKLISGEIDIIPFTSPPAVHNLLSAADEEGKADALAQALNEKTLTASIGPVTTAALRAYGIEPALESKSQKMGGLMQDIAQRVSAGNGAARTGN